jgi:hypothetical protein
MDRGLVRKMKIWNPDQYIKAWNFSSKAHGQQRLAGTEIPYINYNI